MVAKQYRYWTVRMNYEDWCVPEELPEGITYMKGQAEIGEKSGFKHWQIIAYTKTKKTYAWMISKWPLSCEVQHTRSEAVEQYVWKDETSVEGSRFELGKKSVKRNSTQDWNDVWESAVNGKIMDIPADIRIRCYSTLRKIEKDFMQKVEDIDELPHEWIWGPPGVGKSRLAKQENPDHYPKPLNKWWDGYQNEACVIMDDFDHSRKMLGSDLKRWADHYAFIGENKGGAMRIRPKKIVITSNYSIREIFGTGQDHDQTLVEALQRRFKERYIGEKVEFE